MTSNQQDTSVSPLMLSGNPLNWLAVFGPGAVIASLTIGTGELIFSSQGGALFGYRILFLFVVISLLKWVFVLALSRHMVLTGAHAFRRMLDLPGPRGWALLWLFLLVAPATAAWVGFHSGVLGNFTSWVTGTQNQWNGAVDYVWGAVILAGVLVLSASGGYSILERIQMTIVTALVLSAGVSLILYNPDWLEMLTGAVIPQALHYPDWLAAAPDKSVRAIATVPVWVETTRYVGVLAGGTFDYLAYTSWLRNKNWGRAALGEAMPRELQEMAGNPQHPVRTWLRAPLIDCTISFTLVLVFSAVFVASGAIVLAPESQVPNEDNLLDLQARFLTQLHPWLLPLYVAGAFLAMLGTLYGTIEIGCTILDELARTVRPRWAEHHVRRLKLCAVTWCAAGAYIVLTWSFLFTYHGGEGKPRILLAIMTPANLFTNVFSSGLVCAVILWMDRRFLPPGLRMPKRMALLITVGGAVFFCLGIKGYWDNHRPEEFWLMNRWFTIGSMVFLFAASMVAAALIQRRRSR